MCFASDSCGYQIILLQRTQKILLLNIPVPRNKPNKEKYLYQALVCNEYFRKVISLTNCIMSFWARQAGFYTLSPDMYSLTSRLLYDVQRGS